MTGAVRLEILSSLASVREDVERQVAKLDRYRALKVIEQTISDFPGLEDLNNSLSEIRERMQRQIEGTREVRALRAVEKIMPDLSEVLAFLSDCSDAGDARQASRQERERRVDRQGRCARCGSQPATEAGGGCGVGGTPMRPAISAQPAPVEPGAVDRRASRNVRSPTAVILAARRRRQTSWDRIRKPASDHNLLRDRAVFESATGRGGRGIRRRRTARRGRGPRTIPRTCLAGGTRGLGAEVAGDCAFVRDQSLRGEAS